jgi:hypothetical protein
VKHHQPSLAPAPGPTPVRQHHRHGLARTCPASRPVPRLGITDAPLRYRHALSGFPRGLGQRLESGRFELITACSFGFGCSGDAAWFRFGFRLVRVGLVLVLLVLACWFLLGSSAVRSSGPVLDGVDGVLHALFACLVSLDTFVSWCCLGFVGCRETSLSLRSSRFWATRVPPFKVNPTLIRLNLRPRRARTTTTTFCEAVKLPEITFQRKTHSNQFAASENY